MSDSPSPPMPDFRSRPRRLSIWPWLLLAGLLPMGAQAAEAGCLDFNQPYTLEGTLGREVHPGPPDFASIADGDAALPLLILTLQQPICTAERAIDGETRTTRVQLDLDARQQRRWRRRLGKPVRLHGILREGATAWHRAPVLLETPQLQAAPAKP